MPDASPSPQFGVDLAARARPRLGAPIHVRRSSAIGALGRSTLGFGRIIATAGSSRPTVTPDALASRSLRPPVGAWSLLGADDEPTPEPVPWTTRALPTTASVRRSRTPAAAAPTARPTPPKQVDRKVDALRRLLEARGMIEPEEPAHEAADPPPQAIDRAADTSADTSAEPGDAGTAPSAPGDRSATSAGAATAPGQFGRRMRPEPDTPVSPLSSVFPDAVPAPRSRSTAPRSDGDDLDRFRRSLESRGMLASSDTSPPPRSGRTTADRAERPTGTDQRRRPAGSRPAERSTPAPPAPAGEPDGDADGAPGPARRLPLALESAMGPPALGATRSDSDVSLAVSGSILDAGTPHDPGPAASRPGAHDGDDRRRSADGLPPTPDVTTAPIAAAPPPRPGRRTELRRLTDRIGLDRTLADLDARAAPATRPDASPRRPSTDGTVAPPTATLTSALTDRGPSAGPGATPAGGTIAVTNPQTITRTRAVDTDSMTTSTALRRAPVVVTRADEARRATRVVRERIAGRRFESPDTTPGTILRAPSVADPRVDATGPATTFTTPGSTIYRSAVSPGPGALIRALSGDEIASPAAGAGVVAPSRPDRAPGGSPHVEGRPVERTAPSGLRADDATPVAAVRPAAITRPGDAAPAPIGRPVETGRAPRPDDAGGAVRRAADPTTTAPSTAREHAEIAAPRVSDPPATRPTQPTRPTRPDPAQVAADTAEHLTAAGPGDALLRRSPTPWADGAAAPAPPADLGERFLRELGRAPDTAARALPIPFQPLATAIAGSARQVRVSTDATSRRALESVGKQAVTVGDTIHVARPLRDDTRTSEVLAHELVHVANPSPVPRFFDDDHRSPEERTAERVADVIARSPVMPSAPVPSSPVSRGAPSTTAPIRRSPAPGPSTSPGAVSADELAAALDGGSPTPIRRATQSAVEVADSGVGPTDDALGGDVDENRAEPTEGGGTGLAGSGTRAERDWFNSMIERTIDQVVRQVEARVITELERRGGRYWREF